ncbi:MAG: sigma-54-dependent Fis family transcriptional regulator [Desulfovibrionales bacterium]|nr:sigma-54-dependent Fis family transcriptional regulator [Desulfovibrionales bacterium]
MPRHLTIYTSHRDMRDLLLSAAGDEFDTSVRTMNDALPAIHQRQEILLLDLTDLHDADSVREYLENVAGRTPSCRILFMVHDGSVLPESSLLRQYHAEPLLPPFESRNIHLSLSRVALELNEDTLSPASSSPGIDVGRLTRSAVMRDVYRKVQMVAPTRTTVLLTGETGTGKSYLAKLIHQHSARGNRQFVRVHCGALPESLIESELFGHEKGAFTGASKSRKGKFELADGGTIFLDEIGTITPAAQIKLLHILQEKAFERVGGERLIPCDVRIIAATNEDPAALCEQGKFRWDLFYRLNVFPIEVPPLRQRTEDILPLANEFIGNFCQEAGKNIAAIHPRAAAALEHYAWPGNVRELENIVERACILEETDQIQAESLPLELLAFRPDTPSMDSPRSDSLLPLHAARTAAIEEFERRYLWTLLQSCGGSIKKSADMAGITTRQLHKLMTRHHLDKKSFRLRNQRNS